MTTITVTGGDFADAVALAQRAIPARPPIPILGGIVVDATDDHVTVSGFDYERTAQARVDAVVTTPGRFLVSGRLLGEITKQCPKGINVTLDDSAGRIAVTAGRTRWQLPPMPVEDYPELPKAGQPAGTIPAEVLRRAIERVTTACSNDDTTPMLTGVQVQFSGDKLTLAATDRFRLAVQEIGWTPREDAQDFTLLLPATMLAIVARATAGAGEVRVTVTDRDAFVAFDCGGQLVGGRVLDAEFPKWRQLLPTAHTSQVTVESAALARAIAQVEPTADRSAQVRLDITADMIALTCGDNDSGSGTAEVDAQLDGEPLLIAANPTYLTTAIKTVGSDKLTMRFTTPLRPFLVLGDDADTYRHLVMPVRLPAT